MFSLLCARKIAERQRIFSYGILLKSTTPDMARPSLLLASLLFLPISAWAESSEPTELSERLDNNRDTPQLTQGKPIFSDLGEKLDAAGITPHLSLWSLWVSNPSTGPREDEYAITNNIFAGTDFDLENILGIPDATFHFEYIFFPGNYNVGQPTEPVYAGAAGSYFGGSVARNDISNGYLSQFSYEQDYFNGQLKTVVGRINARRYFFENNCSSVVACNDPIWDNATGALPPPYSTWGAFGKIDVSNHNYVKLGAFESDPQQYLDRGYGFDWNPSGSAGESILAAIGQKTTFSEEAYPGQYELIGFYNTSDQYDPRTGERDESGTAGVMFKFRQALWRPDGGIHHIQDPEALLIFGSIGSAPGSNQPYQAFVETGLTYLNPFDRPADMANVKVSYAHLGSRQLQAQHEARVAQGGVDAIGSNDAYRFETNYHIGLPHYMFLEPSVQYIINPSNFYNPGARQLNDDGLVVALQFGINLGMATGLTIPN